MFSAKNWNGVNSWHLSMGGFWSCFASDWWFPSRTFLSGSGLNTPLLYLKPQIFTLFLKISQAQWTLSIASAIQQVWIKHEQLDVVLIVLFWSSASVCISVWIARSKSMYNFNLCETVKKVFCKKLHPWKLLKFLYGVLVLLICVVLVVPTKRYDSNTTLM